MTFFNSLVGGVTWTHHPKKGHKEFAKVLLTSPAPWTKIYPAPDFPTGFPRASASVRPPCSAPARIRSCATRATVRGPAKPSQAKAKPSWLVYLLLGCPRKLVFHLPINGVYWGYNQLTNHLLTSWHPSMYDLYYILVTFHSTDSTGWFKQLNFGPQTHEQCRFWTLNTMG